MDEHEEQFHYGDYLRSERWADLRDWALGAAEGRCQVCNSTEGLNVHHRTYDRLGEKGEINDLTVLCRDCHQGFHLLLAKKRPAAFPQEHQVWPSTLRRRPPTTKKEMQKADP
jgi:5-methylcytosine-specific restriction endonuclease McrA